MLALLSWPQAYHPISCSLFPIGHFRRGLDQVWLLDTCGGKFWSLEAQYSTSSPEFSTSRPDELSTSSESLEFSKNAWEDEKGKGKVHPFTFKDVTLFKSRVWPLSSTMVFCGCIMIESIAQRQRHSIHSLLPTRMVPT